MSVSTAKDTRNSTMISCGGDPLLNIKEHSGKRSCKKKNKLIKIYFFYSCCFQRTTPLHQLGLWTFEPAFSPRFSPTLSPRSIFFHWSAVFTHLEPTILFSYWSAVSHLKPRDFRLLMSPRSFFLHWSAGSHTGNDMTSLICSRPIRSQHFLHTSPMYY